MTFRLTNAQMIAPGLASDDDFANWFVDAWMTTELPDCCYRQDPEMLKDMTISARG